MEGRDLILQPLLNQPLCLPLSHNGLFVGKSAQWFYLNSEFLLQSSRRQNAGMDFEVVN